MSIELIISMPTLHILSYLPIIAEIITNKEKNKIHTAGKQYWDDVYSWPGGWRQQSLAGHESGQQQQQANEGIKKIITTIGITKKPKLTTIAPEFDLANSPTSSATKVPLKIFRMKI